MGELYPPTTADYASASADKALREIEKLKKALRKAGIGIPEEKRVAAKSIEEFLREVYSSRKFSR
jgi:hypothetical protein